MSCDQFYNTKQGIKGAALKSVLGYRDDIAYMHHKTLTRYVLHQGNDNCWGGVRFSKTYAIAEIQIGNGIKAGSDDKTNDKPYAEIVDVIALVMQQKIKELLKNCRVMGLSGDVSEAHKKSEERTGLRQSNDEWLRRFVPSTFLLKRQS